MVPFGRHKVSGECNAIILLFQHTNGCGIIAELAAVTYPSRVAKRE
jgi:hypothetical protein